MEYTFSIDQQGGDILVTLDGTPILLSAAGSSGGWTTFTGSVTATGSLGVLAITNNAPGNTIVFVDNVSLAAVPLPGALVFMASGLALLGRLRRG